MKEDAIVLKNLSVGYRTGRQLHTVADRISAKLKTGQLTCLIGSNGAGKTTLLRTLAGYMTPLEGEILVADDGSAGEEAGTEATYQSLSKMTAAQLARKIAVVLTGRPRTVAMNAEELVGTGRAPYTNFWGSISAHDKQAIEEAMRQTGTTHLRHRRADTLSDGEMQKVIIAKALAQHTSIILLDEPTAYLDYPSRVTLLRQLGTLAHDLDKSILLSTHDLELALQLTDQLWLLDGGQLHTGTARELAKEKALSTFVERAGIELNTESLSLHIRK